MRQDEGAQHSADDPSAPTHARANVTDASVIVADDRNDESKFSVLINRPGVLIRRLQQIQSAMFFEETAAFGVTPLQFSLMTLLVDMPGIEQGAAAAKLRLDRFTTAGVVRRLEAAKYLRTKPGRDRRAKNLYLTARGLKIFDGLYSQAMRAHDRLIEPFPPEKRALFGEMLRELAEHYGSIEGSSKIR